MTSNKIRVLVFDFDGVIIDSNRLKYDAFFQIFPAQEEIQNIIQKVLLKYREKSRFFIIELIMQKLQEAGIIQALKIKPDINLYAKKYRAIVEKGAVECEEIQGAKKCLESLSRHFPLYINSTTPFESLKYILTERNLWHFFKGVYGSPPSKIQNLSSILTKESVSDKEALVIGDGQSDWEAADHFGCAFIGIKNQFNKFEEIDDFMKLDDLKDLPSHILSIKN